MQLQICHDHSAAEPHSYKAEGNASNSPLAGKTREMQLRTFRTLRESQKQPEQTRY